MGARRRRRGLCRCLHSLSQMSGASTAVSPQPLHSLPQGRAGHTVGMLQSGRGSRWISHGLLGLRLLLPGGAFLPVQLHSPSLMVLWLFSRPSASLEGNPEPGGTLLLVSPLVNVSTFPAINSHMCGHFRRFLSFHPPDSLGRNRVHHLTVQALAREERACPGSSEVALLGLHCVQPSSVPVSSLCCAG